MSRTASLLLIIFAWLAVSLITTSQGILTYLATSGTVNVRATLLVNLSLWLPWAILSPAILAAARRWPLTFGRHGALSRCTLPPTSHWLWSRR